MLCTRFASVDLQKGVCIRLPEIGFESGGRKFVYARKDNGFSPADVKLVRRSESEVVITGLNEGQEIAMANPDQAQSKQAAAGALQSLPKK